MPDLRHVERSGEPRDAGREREGEELEGFDPIAEEPRPALGIADRRHHRSEPRPRDEEANDETSRQREAGCREERRARAAGLQVEAENVLEIGQTVIAAEAHVVAKEREHEREGQRLGDDREIDAADPRAKREEPEEIGKQARHQEHHDGREPELIEAVPVPGQLAPVEEDHEIRKFGIAIDAARADLAHEIHAHGIAAEREESAMAEAQDSAKSPDEIDRQREHGKTKILAEQRHHMRRDMEGGIGRRQEVQGRDQHHGHKQDRAS